MKYPIGIQNFGKLIREGFAYVDKTALMYKLVSEGTYYFLSRLDLQAFYSAKIRQRWSVFQKESLVQVVEQVLS